MVCRRPFAKQVFDTACAAFVLVLIAPLLLTCLLAILCLEGRPVFYKSVRRVHGPNSLRIMKFRTMRRDAEKLLNRETVPIERVCFLNIPLSSPAYTRVGRIIERCMLTEMPQLYHVLRGEMSMVGNRPLPENVIAALQVAHPSVRDRLLVPAGLTGPAQLVGRDFLSDADRLRVEVAYCQAVLASYSVMLDVKILFYTVLVGLMPRFQLSPNQVVAMKTPRQHTPGTRRYEGVFRAIFQRR